MRTVLLMWFSYLESLVTRELCEKRPELREIVRTDSAVEAESLGSVGPGPERRIERFKFAQLLKEAKEIKIISLPDDEIQFLNRYRNKIFHGPRWYVTRRREVASFRELCKKGRLPGAGIGFVMAVCSNGEAERGGSEGRRVGRCRRYRLHAQRPARGQIVRCRPANGRGDHHGRRSTVDGCVICHRSDINFTNEHVIPEALGGYYQRKEMVCGGVQLDSRALGG